MIMTPNDASKPAGELVIGDACPGQPNDVVVLRKAPSRVAACAPKSVLEALSVRQRCPRRHAPLLGEVRRGRGNPARSGGRRSRRGQQRRRRGRPCRPKPRGKGTGLPSPRALGSRSRCCRGRRLHGAPRSPDGFEGRCASRRGAAPSPAVSSARIRFGDLEETVEVGAPDDKGGAIVRRLHDGALLGVDPETVRRLAPRDTSFRARTIFAETDRRVAKLVFPVRLPAGGRRRRHGLQDGRAEGLRGLRQAPSDRRCPHARQDRHVGRRHRRRQLRLPSARRQLDERA